MQKQIIRKKEDLDYVQILESAEKNLFCLHLKILVNDIFLQKYA